MKIEMQPIGYVKNDIEQIADDQWKGTISNIILSKEMHPQALQGLDEFSHAMILFYMDQVADEKAVSKYRHPRNNSSLPLLGTFAQRNKSRPNKIGLSTVKIHAVEGQCLQVLELDAVNGTPILDIKPYMAAFGARGPVFEPEWVEQIMSKYWE